MGANKGIGKEITRQLGLQGYTVLLGVRDAARGAQAAEELRAEKIDAHPLELDVTEEDSVRRAAEEVGQRFGRLDALVNNAGVNREFGGQTQPSGLSLADFRATYDTNVFGAFAVTKAFLPLLKAAPAGRIVNLASTLGSLQAQGDPKSPFFAINTLAYNSSKTALNAQTVAFAKELAGSAVKINSTCPGWVKTDMGSDAAPRTVEEGAREPVRLATLPDDGPTGGFFDEMELHAINKQSRWVEITSDVEEVTGKPARDFAQFARDHAEKFRQI